MEILERGSVLIELSRLLHAARTAGGRLLFLGGEAGIGKTALIRRFREMVEGSTRVLPGHAIRSPLRVLSVRSSTSLRSPTALRGVTCSRRPVVASRSSVRSSRS